MSEVIVAPATPWGHGALAIVRLSGPGLLEVLRGFCAPHAGWPVPSGRPRRVRFRDADGVFDDGLLVLGRAPATATGEDLAELTCHGNPLIVERLVDAALACGARLADPGEFTRRAWLHGKLDLVAAEGVLQISRARTARGIEIARDALEGRVGAFFGEVRASLLDAVAELEARLDHPDDELALEDDAALVARLDDVAASCDAAVATLPAGRALVEGARIALVGAVNAGKSSLFNALLGRSRALVHDTPGTTRDVLEASAVLGPVAVTLLDTAGERETRDPIEAAGLALARELVADADLLVVVLRARASGPDEAEAQILARTADRPRLVVTNGIDRAGVDPLPGSLSVSAHTGVGLDALRTAIVAALVGDAPGNSRLVIASARQRDGLREVARCAREARDALPLAGPAVASEVATRGVRALDDLTGADTREAVLDTLFARFCIGK